MPASARLPSGTLVELLDRKSTRLNSSHSSISYAVFCLKKKKNYNKKIKTLTQTTNLITSYIIHMILFFQLNIKPLINLTTIIYFSTFINSTHILLHRNL